MNIKIKMISGEEFTFTNNRYKTIPDWIKGNFSSDVNFRWFSIAKNTPALNIECIESIREIDEFLKSEGEEK